MGAPHVWDMWLTCAIRCECGLPLSCAHYPPTDPCSQSHHRLIWPVAQQRGVVQTITLYQTNGEFAGVRRFGSTNPIEIAGLKLWVDGVVGTSGLELKADPGVPLVYAGFGGVCCSWNASRLAMPCRPVMLS